MPKRNKTVNSQNMYRDRSGGAIGTAAKPMLSGGARLQLPAGEPDLEALRSVTREWLVPRLVEKFLRTHGVELKHVGKLANRLQLPLPERLSLVGDKPGSRTSIEADTAGPKKLDRRRTRKRNIGR